ncbi:MAG: hypothetical protein Kow00114_25170 [Kiloniellaceae bacterium]
MAVGDPVQPDFETQNATVYKGNIDNAIAAQSRLGWAFAPHGSSPAAMTVRLAAGAIFIGGALTEVAAQTTGVITAPTVNPRIDRVVIDAATGAAEVVTGSEAPDPDPPAVPAGKLPVARVALSVGMTQITNLNLTDERVAGSGILPALADARDVLMINPAGDGVVWAPAVASGTAQATTSGVARDWTDIPPGVKRITFVAENISTNGVGQLIVQVGDATGGLKTSGYVGAAALIGGSPVLASSGFPLHAANTSDASVMHVALDLYLVDAATHKWVGKSTLSFSNGSGAVHEACSSVTLSGPLDRLRFTTVAGTNALDGGSANIHYQ